MADAFTDTAALDLDQATYDLALYYALRPRLYHDAFATVKSTTAAPARGVSVIFEFIADLADATTTLSETVDVDAVALSDSQVTVTLAEKGNAINTTFKARATAYTPLEPAVVNTLGYNAGSTLDTLARNALIVGTNVLYGGNATATANIDAADTLGSANVRRAFAELQDAAVIPFGSYYAAIVSPRQAYDLKSETGVAAWRDPHVYSQPNEIWTGELGEYEGFRFIVSPRTKNDVDAGAGAVDVFDSIFFGQEALAKAFSTYEGRGPMPTMIVSPVVDKLRRLQPMGWHWFGGYGLFRQASIWRVETASSIATNV